MPLMNVSGGGQRPLANLESVQGALMERFSTEPMLTSSEAAGLLAVHASTVKRWCNDGELAFDTTTGGHRRIHLGEALAFAREREIGTVLSPFRPYEAHVWTALQAVRQDRSFDRAVQLAMGWITRGRVRRAALLFDALAHEPGVSFCRFVDQGLRVLMEQVGTAWAEGRLRVGEEHLVSQAVSEVLVRISAESVGDPAPDAAPVAIVGTLEGNQHHLGALTVRVLLERLGWDVCYLGPDVPIEDFGALQRSRDATLVCISLPPPAAAGDAARVVRVLGETYDASRPYALALGGSFEDDVDGALLSGAFTSVETFAGCRVFAEALVEGFVPQPAARA